MDPVNKAPATILMDSPNAPLSKRQQRAANRAGTAVTPPLPEVTKSVTKPNDPKPPVGGVTIINNADVVVLRDLENRVKKLSAENDKLKAECESTRSLVESSKAANDVAMVQMQEKLSAAQKENARLAELLAVKSSQTVVHAGIIQEKVRVATDSNPNTSGVPTPDVDDFTSTIERHKPVFAEYIEIVKKMTIIRQALLNLYKSGLTNQAKEEEFLKYSPDFNSVNDECRKIRQKVLDCLADLKRLKKLGENKLIPEEYLRWTSSKTQTPMSTLKENIAKYDKALADCDKQISLMDQEIINATDRFSWGAYYYNKIVDIIDPRDGVLGSYLNGPKTYKYQYVNSGMDATSDPKAKEVKAV